MKPLVNGLAYSQRWQQFRESVMKEFNHTSGRHISIESAKIYFEVIGNEDLPPLLVLHGGFGNIENFNTILPSLLTQYRIIGIDCRGQGKSTLGNKELTYQLLQTDIVTILNHLEINDLSILGFSDGGVISYRLASFTGLKINKLITVGSRWHVKNIQPMKEIFSKITGEVLRVKYPSNYEIYQKYNPEPDVTRLGEELVRLWLDESESGYPNEKIENITCNTLLLRGENDPIVSEKDLTETSELIKKSKIITIPDANHVVFRDQKERFLSAVKGF